MKHLKWLLAFLGLFASTADAALVTVNAVGTTTASAGTYATDFGTGADYPTTAGGDPIEAQFVFDSALANILGSPSSSTFARVYSTTSQPGTQYFFQTTPTELTMGTPPVSPYYSFVTSPSVTPFNGSGAYMDTGSSSSCAATTCGTAKPASSSLSMIIYNDVPVNAANNFTAGTLYDQISLIGTVFNPFGGGDLHTWRLDLYGTSNWLSASNSLPTLAQFNELNGGANFIGALLSITETDATGANVGVVDAGVGVSSVATVPVPAAVWLLGSGLIGLVAVGRRRQEFHAIA
ncbi:MAG: VPLPA-CTERM sorting domain-containing protein [Gammaproteobacteria bacterium]|nr:VPLPA-CTERM sorting domain-containing protein [Gammaproteobacteria bacterium]